MKKKTIGSEELLSRTYRRLASMVVALALLALHDKMSSAQINESGRPSIQLTLKRAVEMAMQHNRQITLARLATADSREKLAIAKSLYYPRITNQSSALYLSDVQGVVLPAGVLSSSPTTGLIPSQTIRIGQGAQDTFTSSTALVQPLTQLIKVRAGEKAAQSDVKAAQFTQSDAENSIALLVYKLYFGILASQSQLQADQASVLAAETKDEEGRRGVAEGKALEVVSLQNHVQLLDQRQSVLKTRISLEDAMLQLDDALGLPLGTKLELDPSVMDDEAQLSSRATAMEAIRTHSPKVLEAQQTVEKAKAGLTAARAAYIPNITGTASYSYQNGVPFLVHNFGTFGGIVSFDLFDGGAREAKVREAKIELDMAQTKLDAATAEASISIATAYDQVEQLKELVNVAKEALQAKSEAVRVSQERLSQNAEMLSGVAKSQSEVASQKASLLQAELSLILAERNIRQILGERP
ncbi:MAG: TolC family protein [Edaphobacter sp.]